jgi:hypothetical protein
MWRHRWSACCAIGRAITARRCTSPVGSYSSRRRCCRSVAWVQRLPDCRAHRSDDPRRRVIWDCPELATDPPRVVARGRPWRTSELPRLPDRSRFAVRWNGRRFVAMSRRPGLVRKSARALARSGIQGSIRLAAYQRRARRPKPRGGEEGLGGARSFGRHFPVQRRSIFRSRSDFFRSGSGQNDALNPRGPEILAESGVRRQFRTYFLQGFEFIRFSRHQAR